MFHLYFWQADIDAACQKILRLLRESKFVFFLHRNQITTDKAAK